MTAAPITLGHLASSPIKLVDQHLLAGYHATELQPLLRFQVAREIWGCNSDDTGQTSKAYDAYFIYFTEECKLWKHTGRQLAIQSFRDFLDLVKHLKLHAIEPRCSSAIHDFFLRWQASPEEAQNSIILTVRLWLMLNVDTAPQGTGNIFSGKSLVLLEPSVSLADLVAQTFPRDAASPILSTRRFWPKSFNACNFNRTAGFRTVFTSNLADHLKFDDDMETIRIYHHATILRSHQTEDQSTQTPPIYPADLMDETLLTLALLLPRTDVKTQKWYRKLCKAQSEQPAKYDTLAACQPLESQMRLLHKYKYWNERLTIIAEAFDRAEPKNLFQWWIDRRKRVQWFTFWLALWVVVLTIVFGVLQSVAGFMQAEGR